MDPLSPCPLSVRGVGRFQLRERPEPVQEGLGLSLEPPGSRYGRRIWMIPVSAIGRSADASLHAPGAWPGDMQTGVCTPAVLRSGFPGYAGRIVPPALPGTPVHSSNER